MDTANVLLEHFPILEIVRMWVAAIKPNPGEIEPCKGMDCMDVTVGGLLVGKMCPTAHHQAIIVLGGCTSSCLLKILMIRVQVQGDVPMLE